ncbi:MAG: tetratricopeptide repeat protein [Acidobacteria bacterium]|nr:tetratricopeptide repeat protein [Acidobacteriota bacterium]
MNSTKSIAGMGWVALACLLLVTGGCAKLKARDELRKGVNAYKAGTYPLAIENFKNAIQLDPTLLNAKLYLATTYAVQYVPGSETEENLKIGEQAVAEYKGVLQADPNNVGCISGIANLYFQMKRMDEAKEFFKKQIAVDPSDAAGHYMIAVINWRQAYEPRMILKVRLKLKPDDPIKDQKERQALAERNVPVIEEGLQMLNKAMELRADYGDAMAYVNLLYREKADLADTPEAREEYLKQADMWIEKSLAIKKAEAEKAARSQG